jgi:hypothetical protein
MASTQQTTVSTSNVTADGFIDMVFESKAIPRESSLIEKCFEKYFGISEGIVRILPQHYGMAFPDGTSQETFEGAITATVDSVLATGKIHAYSTRWTPSEDGGSLSELHLYLWVEKDQPEDSTAARNAFLDEIDKKIATFFPFAKGQQSMSPTSNDSTGENVRPLRDPRVRRNEIPFAKRSFETPKGTVILSPRRYGIVLDNGPTAAESLFGTLEALLCSVSETSKIYAFDTKLVSDIACGRLERFLLIHLWGEDVGP